MEKDIEVKIGIDRVKLKDKWRNWNEILKEKEEREGIGEDSESKREERGKKDIEEERKERNGRIEMDKDRKADELERDEGGGRRRWKIKVWRKI